MKKLPTLKACTADHSRDEEPIVHEHIHVDVWEAWVAKLTTSQLVWFQCRAQEHALPIWKAALDYQDALPVNPQWEAPLPRPPGIKLGRAVQSVASRFGELVGPWHGEAPPVPEPVVEDEHEHGEANPAE